jgi:hypothetical protein
MLNANQIATAVTTAPEFVTSFSSQTREEKILLAETHEAIARQIRASLELERRSGGLTSGPIVWRFAKRRR